MMLGFGSTEQEAMERENADVETILKAMMPTDYITTEMEQEVKRHLEARSKDLQAEYEQFKTVSDHPDRYYTFRYSVLHDANHLVVVFHFMHINRVHPFSPDGWAAMSTRHLCCIEHLDLVMEHREAERKYANAD